MLVGLPLFVGKESWIKIKCYLVQLFSINGLMRFRLMKKHRTFSLREINQVFMFVLIVLTNSRGVCLSAKQDFVVQGAYEAALDLPRIYFLLKRLPDGHSLGPGGNFELNYAFLDTGASGILISKETANRMGISLDANAQFVDIGAGGKEYFNVSESLYMGLAGYEARNPRDTNVYKILGPGRFQVKRNPAGLLGEPIDVVGMPVMIERTVVLDSGATNSLGYFAADIKKQSSASIPKVDIKVALDLKMFADPGNPNNIPPLPVLAPNPVINNIKISYKGKLSKSNWLLDTGATVSFISTRQARELGLINEMGKPIVEPDFSVPVGGVGSLVQLQGFEIDALIVPTMSGYNLVFKNARLAVHDIKYFDRDEDKYRVIDGVFGSNFLCASAKMKGLLPSDVSKTVFDNIVIDMQKRTLGFDVREAYQAP